MATILIVEDRALNREFLVTLLGYANHQLLVASQGVEALRIAKETPLDLIITDILMPTMDGYELAKKLKADPDLAKIPIIFYTATYRIEEGRRLAESCGVKYVLTKPADPELILETVNQALGITEKLPSAASLMKNMRELRDLSNQYIAVTEFNYNLIAEHDPAKLLKLFCEGVCKIVNAKYAAAGILNDNDSTLKYAADSGNKESIAPYSAHIAQVMKGQVMRNPDFVGLPFSTPSHIYGYCYIIGKKNGSDFDETETQLICTFSEQVAILYENMESYNVIQRHAANLQIEKTAREKAEDESQVKSNFIATISHELRTPLNAIIGYSELLEEETRKKNLNSFNDDLKRIIYSARYLLYLINSLLDVSKIESGKMDVYLEETSINMLVQDVQAMIQPLVEKNNNKLNIKYEKEMDRMYTDVQRVRQSLLNILSNANKFTKGGEITLDVKLVKKNKEAMVQFTISDTGIGIPMDKIGKLFHPFSQIDASTTRKYGGTGLGLYLTKRFCEMLGGDIEVKSQEGKGSMFTMFLPQKSILEPAGSVGNITEK